MGEEDDEMTVSTQAGTGRARRAMTGTGRVARLIAAGLGSGLLLCLPAMAAAQGPSAPTLRQGDLVELQVMNRPELSGQFRVNRFGTLAHPLYRDVRVEGIPLDRVEEQFRTILSQTERDPRLWVQPLFRVNLGGEVLQPGQYHLPPGSTLLDAIHLAGGLTRDAKPELELVRESVTRHLMLRDPSIDGGGAPIQSGDEIAVLRESNFNFMTQVFLPLMTTAATVASIINLSR